MIKTRSGIVALAGGVGGAKLAQGLASVLGPEELSIVVNTGDDFTHLGFFISPDIDTVTYTLAGIQNKETGWGISEDTWQCMEGLKQLGAETWFRLGDKDIATHIERTRRLKSGECLTTITRDHCKKLGIRHSVIPMSDEPAPTIIHTEDGPLSFQDYFVRQQCLPKVTQIENIRANPSQAFLEALDRCSGIIICPSNPFLSIAPILKLQGIENFLKQRKVPVVAVSPIISGKALKGPAAKIMQELGLESSVAGVQNFYKGLIDGMVIDKEDHLEGALITSTKMHGLAESSQLSREILEWMFACR